MKHQNGFTLIELLIAIALGLLVTAAAVMLFITGYKSYALQQGSGDIQDNANFGLNQLTKDLRLAHLNTLSSFMGSETAGGGIVFTSAVNAFRDTTQTPSIIKSNLNPNITGSTAAVTLLSRSSGDAVGTAPAWTGLSNGRTTTGTALVSDQLVIQYTPTYVLDDNGTATTTDDRWVGGYDCEGRELRYPINTTSSQGQRVIVQRYFLRRDTVVNGNEPNERLALACDAGSYDLGANPTVISDYGDNGEIIIKRVDHFRVLLGVQIKEGTNDRYRYMSTREYMALTAPRPRILSLQLGMLVRSIEAVGNVDEKERARMNAQNQFYTVLDQNVKVAALAAGERQYARQVISQTVAFRNSFGERGQ